MNIFEHLLPDGAILGVGPLMVEGSTLQHEEIVYGTRRYYFALHLAAHTTVVTSDWFRPKLGESEIEKMKRWQAEYRKVRNRVAALINEDPEARGLHIDKVGETYECLKDQLHNLFADLVPAPHNQEPVNERITNIYRTVQALRDLACK